MVAFARDAGVLFVSGLTIALTLIASVAVIEAAVPHERLTEALGWTSMAWSPGGGGAAGLGHLVDLGGWAAAGPGGESRQPGRAATYRSRAASASSGVKPVALILSRPSRLCTGRGASCLPSP